MKLKKLRREVGAQTFSREALFKSHADIFVETFLGNIKVLRIYGSCGQCYKTQWRGRSGRWNNTKIFQIDSKEFSTLSIVGQHLERAKASLPSVYLYLYLSLYLINRTHLGYDLSFRA